MSQFGRIDCLVNNAGGQFTAAAEDITPGGWRAVRRLNLDAPWFLTQAVAKRWMIPNRAGRVISVVLCPERGIAGMAHSSAARAGMGALTRTLAMEWGRHGIALNCVAPGWIDTEGVRGYGLDLDEVAAQVPMKRLGKRRRGGRSDRLSGLARGGVHHRADDRHRRRRRPDEQRLGAAAGAELARHHRLPSGRGRTRLDRRTDRPAGRACVPGRSRPCDGARALARAREAGPARGRGRGGEDRGGKGARAGRPAAG